VAFRNNTIVVMLDFVWVISLVLAKMVPVTIGNLIFYPKSWGSLFRAFFSSVDEGGDDFCVWEMLGCIYFC
jgi:hypothetical protein